MAQEELQMVYQASEVNEKIFQGKVMEIKGRQLVMSRGQGSVKTEIRADDPRAEALLNALAYTEAEMKPKKFGETVADSKGIAYTIR